MKPRIPQTPTTIRDKLRWIRREWVALEIEADKKRAILWDKLNQVINEVAQ